MTHELTIYIEIPVRVTVEYSPGRDNSRSGEMLNINGRRVRGPRLLPDDPEEIELIAVESEDGREWSDVIFDRFPDDDKLIELVKEQSNG